MDDGGGKGERKEERERGWSSSTVCLLEGLHCGRRRNGFDSFLSFFFLCFFLALEYQQRTHILTFL